MIANTIEEINMAAFAIVLFFTKSKYVKIIKIETTNDSTPATNKLPGDNKLMPINPANLPDGSNKSANDKTKRISPEKRLENTKKVFVICLCISYHPSQLNCIFNVAYFIKSIIYDCQQEKCCNMKFVIIS